MGHTDVFFLLRLEPNSRVTDHGDAGITHVDDVPGHPGSVVRLQANGACSRRPCQLILLTFACGATVGAAASGVGPGSPLALALATLGMARGA